MPWKSSFVLLCAVGLVCLAANAQNSSMGASTGLGPGDTFSLFVTFQEPMPKIDGINCQFKLVGAAKLGQEHFYQALNSSGVGTKVDDTHYRMQVSISQGTAEGDYKLDSVSVTTGSASRSYRDNDLPTLAPVAITNHEHLKFSDIKKLDVQK